MSEETAQLLDLEQRNANQLAKLTDQVGDLSREVSSLHTAVKGRTDTKWFMGFVILALGSGFGLLWQNTGNVRSEVVEQVRSAKLEIHDHTVDRHPTIVQAEVIALNEVVEILAAEQMRIRDSMLLDNEREIQNAIERTENTISRKMMMDGMVESMKRSAQAGREAAGNSARFDEALRQLEARMLQYHAGENGH